MTDTAPASSPVPSTQDPQVLAAARVPLELYIRGHAEDNAEHMRAAFLPTARLDSRRDGPLTSWTLDFYCQRFQNQPAADEAQRRRTIDVLDVTGTAAMAKVTLVHGAMTFVDYFVLVQTDEGWKIASKTFHALPTEEGSAA